MRNWLMGVTATALAIHVAFPLAPPRMLAGFVDTLDVFGPDIYPADHTQSVANQFAAMPSLHFGWSVIVAAGFVMVVRNRWRWLALAHPVITLLAIVATANHYWLDAAVAGLLVAAVATLTVVPARRRERTPETVAVDVPVPPVVETPCDRRTSPCRRQPTPIAAPVTWPGHVRGAGMPANPANPANPATTVRREQSMADHPSNGRREPGS
jgi:hypothetical protein